MKVLATRFGVPTSLIVLCLCATFALASPDKGQKKVIAEPPGCPACKMTMTTKKDKNHTVAVKVKGKTYYCCDKCPMNKKAAPPKKKK